MEDFRPTAQADLLPSKRTQQDRVLDTIAEQGFITMLGAWEDRSCHITKLATRISEIEHKCGKRFQREAMYRTNSEGRKVRYNTKYTVPAGLTIEDFRTKE